METNLDLDLGQNNTKSTWHYKGSFTEYHIGINLAHKTWNIKTTETTENTVQSSSVHNCLPLMLEDMLW